MSGLTLTDLGVGVGTCEFTPVPEPWYRTEDGRQHRHKFEAAAFARGVRHLTESGLSEESISAAALAVVRAASGSNGVPVHIALALGTDGQRMGLDEISWGRYARHVATILLAVLSTQVGYEVGW